MSSDGKTAGGSGPNPAPGDDSGAAESDNDAESARITSTVLAVVTATIDTNLLPLNESTASTEPRQAPLSTRGPYLVVLNGPAEGEVIRLHPGTALVIGRAEQADIQIRDEGISRAHARVIVSGDQVQIEDLGSHNGTFVGLERIDSRVLASDDIIRVGADTIMRFAYLDSLDENLHRRLVSAALRDPLTGLFNRRHFDDRLIAEGAAARRHRRPLSIALLDIDDFKLINDTHGHSIGDAVLRTVSAALASGSRREDALFRYGGEEFAVLARETPIAGAVVLGERLRAAVAGARFPLGSDGDLRVTISVGVAELVPTASNEDLVDAADKALYASKRGGKNCVSAAPVESP